MPRVNNCKCLGGERTRFKKGQVPFNKGKRHSEESRKKMSESAKLAFRNGKISPLKGNNHFTGKHHTEEAKKKISITHLGKPKIGNRAEKSHLWKGGITSINRIIRHSLEYRIWHRAILERDNFTCVWCGKRGGKLNVDHIKSFSEYPELRFAIDNGRVLCVECHKRTSNYGGRYNVSIKNN